MTNRITSLTVVVLAFLFRDSRQRRAGNSVAFEVGPRRPFFMNFAIFCCTDATIFDPETHLKWWKSKRTAAASNLTT